MYDSIAGEIITAQERMAGLRSNWDNHWQQVGELMLPRQDDFTTKREDGAKRTDKIFDSTAILALERFAATMESLLTPRTQRWHMLRSQYDELNDIPEVDAWFEQVNKILFAVRYSPRANYASQQFENYMGLGAFGTAAMFIDEIVGFGIRYKSIHLSQMFIAENFQGMIDQVHRKFQFTARQAVQKWGQRCPEIIRTVAEKQPERKFDFIHCVKPNTDKQYGRKDFKGMAYSSYYVSLEGRALLEEGGYNTFPYAISRYVTAPDEVYGRSPGMTVLPEVKMLQEMEKTNIRALHKLVDPPLLLRDDNMMQQFSTKPNALNYGGVDSQGRQMVHPLQTNARVDLGEQKSEQKRKHVNDAFLVTLFQILVEQPKMTATEVLQRVQEKGALLSPTMGRQQSENLGPQIEREIDILARAGQLPPMPQVLAEYSDYKIEYDSPLSRAQKAEDLIGIQRTIEMALPFVPTNPEIMDNFNLDEIIKVGAEINGMPRRTLRTDEEKQAIREGRAQQNELAQAAQAGLPATQALKNIAEVQKMGETVG